jgi:glutamate---cysteine ligase / carboxylate-amine ligase
VVTAPVPTRLTVGVEEEFLLLDPRTGENAPAAGKAYVELPGQLRHRARREFRDCMAEMVTEVCTGLDELGEQLLAARRAVAASTEAAVVAIGATPVADPIREPVDDTRFHEIVRHYGPIARDPAVCGCHVHVGVPDRQLAVEVCTRLRGWLPVIQALAANSPLFEGVDSGHASWRSMQLVRWPCVGPWPHLESVADLERTVATLVASGTMLNDSMTLWYAKPSATFPTVEVRVADVCPQSADTVLVAGLVRGLVATTLEDAVAGRPAPRISDVVLRAAHDNAARTGLDGTLLDVHSGRAHPAWDLVADLLDRITPALDRHDDLDTVTTGLDRLRHLGNGATRQRRLLATHGLPGVLTEQARTTLA